MFNTGNSSEIIIIMLTGFIWKKHGLENEIVPFFLQDPQVTTDTSNNQIFTKSDKTSEV